MSDKELHLSDVNLYGKYHRLPKHTLAEARRRAKWKAERVSRGFADCDLWNMDDYLLTIIPDMLDRYAEISIGHPASMTYEEYMDKVHQLAKDFRAFRAARDGQPKDPKEWKEYGEMLESMKQDVFKRLADIFDTLWD